MGKTKKPIKLELVDWFSAKGLKNVFIAHYMLFGGRRKYTLDLWSTKDGRLLMRFHHKCVEADNYAYEIEGMQFSDIQKDMSQTLKFPLKLLPKVITEAFDNWMASEMPFSVSSKAFCNFDMNRIEDPWADGSHIRVIFGKLVDDGSD
jgi:hypothetical protein